jgi:hypothetical protein
LAPLSDHAVVLDVEMLLRARAVFALDDVRSAGPCRIHVALFKQEALDQIVGTPDDDVLALALLNGEDRRQRLVFNFHRGDGLAKLVLGSVGEQNDGFVAMIHHPIGEARLIGEDDLDVIFAGDVGSRDDGEFSPIDAAVVGDGADETAGDRTTDSSSVNHAIACDVIDVAGTAQQLVHAFLAGDGSANNAGFLARSHDWEGLNPRTG